MRSTIEASVVVLPEPVGPVTRTSPRGSRASSPTTSGSPSSASVWAPTDTRRNTSAHAPRARYAFTRKRPTPESEYAKSASLVALNEAISSAGSTSPTIDSVSAGRSSGAWSRRNRPSTRTRGEEPTLQCRSDPFVLARACSRGTTDWGRSLTTYPSASRAENLTKAPKFGCPETFERPRRSRGARCGTMEPAARRDVGQIVAPEPRRSHEQELSQEARPQADQGQPRQPSELLRPAGPARHRGGADQDSCGVGPAGRTDRG